MSSSPNRFQLPLNFVSGDSFALQFTLTELPSSPFILTSWGTVFTVFNAQGQAVITVPTNSGTPASGQIIFKGSISNGKQLTNGETYSAVITSPDGTQKITLMMGTVTTEPAGGDTSATFTVNDGTIQVAFQQLIIAP